MKNSKRILALLLCTLMVLALVPALSAYAESCSGTCGDNLTWILEDGVLTISGTGDMADYDDELDVPWCDYRESIHSVIISNGVTSIGADAFDGCDALTSVTIPDGVTTIGDGAFCSCSALTSVAIPDSVTSIGDSAFYWCDALTSVTIPDSITSIAINTFGCCSALTSITIPDSVTTIGDYAFSHCSALTSITVPAGVSDIGAGAFGGCGSLNISVDSDNPFYSSVDGVLFNKDQTEIISYSKDNICPQYDIPDSVTSIGDDAFYWCDALTGVTIPSSVTDIGWGAFFSCINLANITLPDTVTYIGSGAFISCYALTSITIPVGVTTISNSVFFDCNALTSITIPKGVAVIDASAFDSCPALTSVTIPDSVTQIGNFAFWRCEALTDVYYSGSEDEWNSISIGEENDCLTNATIHYNSSSTDEISVTLNGSKITFDQQPIIIDGRTMVPLRAIFEALGASVDWDNTTQTVTAEKDGTIVKMTIGQTTMYVNGSPVTLDVAPQLVNSRTLVPARAVAESFNCNVDWNNDTRTVIITY